jgi:hypothetical protein
MHLILQEPHWLFAPLKQTHLLVFVFCFAGDGGGPGAGESPAFRIRAERITLRGEERVTMNLGVVPLRAGSLTVEGVAWTLNGVARGQRAFRIARPRPRKSGGSQV